MARELSLTSVVLTLVGFTVVSLAKTWTHPTRLASCAESNVAQTTSGPSR